MLPSVAGFAETLPSVYSFILEVFRGVYGQNPVAIKRLKDDSKAAQSFLDEASVMT